MVTVPRRAGLAQLAYLTPAELDAVRVANVGGVNPQHRAYRGPGGVPRYDDGGDGGGSGDGSDGGGGGSADGGMGDAGAGVGDSGDALGADAGMDSATGGFGLSPAEADALGVNQGQQAASSGGFMDGLLGVLGMTPATAAAKGTTLGLGMSGLTSHAPGLAGLAGLAAQMALGQNPTPGQVAGLGLGTIGTAIGGPALGIGLGMLGQTMVDHGNTNDPAGAAMAGQAAQAGTDTPSLDRISGLSDRLGQMGVINLAAGGIAPIGNHAAHLSHRYANGSGLVPGASAGRADAIAAAVPTGSYVLPADVVSSLGQGNTQAGGKMLAAALPSAAPRHFATGGMTGYTPSPVRLSAGEFVVHPSHVAALGGGDEDAGAAVLDDLVQRVRQQIADSVQSMPPPR